MAKTYLATRAEVNAKTAKHILQWDGGNVITDTLTGNAVTFDDLYELLMNQPEFVVLVHSNKAYHPNTVSTSTIVFDSTTVSNGNVRVDRISMATNGTVTSTYGIAEKTVSKTDDIANNATDSNKYPSTKGVADYVSGGFLPLTGGTLSGNITLDHPNSYSGIHLLNGSKNREVVFETGGDMGGHFTFINRNHASEGDYTQIIVNDETQPKENAIKLIRQHGSEFGEYNLFGEHNRGNLPKIGIIGHGMIDAGQYGMHIYFRNDDSETNYRGFHVTGSNGYPTNTTAWGLSESINGTYKEYVIFSQHNKPTGQYNGNGSAATRTINVGGLGAVLMLWNWNHFGFIHQSGGFIMADNYSSYTRLSESQIKFVNGVLTIATNSASVNYNGESYSYQVL